jgi:putative addiction module killer protein
VQLIEYISPTGISPFGKWFDRLDAQAAAKVTVALKRMEQGNLSNTKSVGRGVQEFRIDFGPGYRVYFGRYGDEIIMLLAGGMKKRQQEDIAAAQDHWSDFKRRKAEGK